MVQLKSYPDFMSDPLLLFCSQYMFVLLVPIILLTSIDVAELFALRAMTEVVIFGGRDLFRL